MQVRETRVRDAYEVTPVQHRDDRGTFLEWFREDALVAATGRSLALRQANTSVSRRGTIRGIHYASVPPGQAKYVSALSGAVLDVIVDVRVGSPTFGTWDAVRLDDVARNAVFISEGLGHGFVALTEDAVVSYLCSEGYAPEREFGLDPLDPDLAIDWQVAPAQMLLSPKDAAAPSLRAAELAGRLPSWSSCRVLYQSLSRPR